MKCSLLHCARMYYCKSFYMYAVLRGTVIIESNNLHVRLSVNIYNMVNKSILHKLTGQAGLNCICFRVISSLVRTIQKALQTVAFMADRDTVEALLATTLVSNQLLVMTTFAKLHLNYDLNFVMKSSHK